MISERRQARRAVLQALFELDQTGHAPDQVLDARLQEANISEPPVIEFANSLFQGVLRNKEAIDSMITSAATTWPIEQAAASDRVALEVGVYELCFSDDVPVEVAINEAVELAKVFGGENSAGFVNGVLRGIAERSATHSQSH